MVRSIVAIIAGLVVMLIVVASVQWMSHSLYPPPVDLDIGDKQAVAKAMAAAPVGALAMVLLSYALGTFLAAGTAATLSVRHKRGTALILGAVMVVLAGANFVIIPYHPLWMVVSGLLIPIPMALLGWRVFR